MLVTPRRILAGAGLVGAAFIACSTFSEEAPAANDDAGAEAGSEEGSVDGAIDGGPDAALCIPSTPRAATTTTCGGESNVDLLLDPKNCGACGRVCNTCTNGLCPVEIEGTGSPGQGAEAIVLTPENVFQGQATAGYVFRRPRSPAPGLALFTFAANDYAQGLALDGDRLFVAAYRGVYELSATSDGGASPVSYDNTVDYHEGFGQTKDDVYWATSTSTLVFMQKDGGNLRVYGDPAGGARSTGVAGDDQAVFWIRRGEDGGPPHEIRLRRADSAVRTRLTKLVDPAALTMDATDLYWVSASRGELMRASRAGTDEPRLVAKWTVDVHTRPGPSANDAEYVYWVMHNPGDANDSVLVRAPKACNGDVTTIVKRPITSNLVIDGTYLYFASLTNVFRVSR